MKHKIVLLLLLGALSAIFLACQNPVSPVSPVSPAGVQVDGASRAFDTTGWNLTWSDEFNGSAVNTANWNFEIGNGAGGWGNNELQYYQAANATVANGVLSITAKKENIGGFSYSSARLQTKAKVTAKYGKIAARIKNPEGMGMWPAFWLLGSNIDSVGWPACGEIDVMELMGGVNDYKTLATCHWSNAGSYANYGLSYTNGSKLSADYHVYEVEWDASYIRARFDGVEYYVIATTPAELSEFQNSFFLLLNLAVGGNFFGGVASTPAQITANLPQTMSVDWVRIYSKGGSTTATPVPTATVAPTQTPVPTATPVSGFSSGVSYAANTATIYFKPGWTATFTDVHYKLNSGAQLNYRMSYNAANARWEQVIANVASGTRIDYFFTYEKSGLAYDSAQYSYTAAGNSSATPVPTATAAPTATPVAGISSGVSYAGNVGTIYFKPNWTSTYVDVHYKLNGGGQLNYRMANNATTGQWTQTVANLLSGNKLDYFFTYEKSGLSYDTAWVSYTKP